MFKFIHALNDKKVNCFSILTEVKMGDYYAFVKGIYQNVGGIENQRPPLTTKSARIIRERMVKDIKEGSVIPSIVLGSVIEEEEYENILDFYSKQDNNGVQTIISKIVTKRHHISIIDGMQRTTAIAEILLPPNSTVDFSNKLIRIEFWLATSVRSLIYRMLVLNTGQIPWKLDRQIKVLYADVEKEIKASLGDSIDLLNKDTKNNTRKAAGQYPSSDVLILFIVFGAKTIDPDTNEEVADEFKRLDFVNSARANDFTNIFISILRMITLLDAEFARIEEGCYGEVELKKINSGLAIFGSQPARVGFVFALTEYIIGINGAENSLEQKGKAREKCESIINNLVTKMKNMEILELAEWVDLPELNEKINQRASKGGVGRFERELYYRAFRKMLIEEANHPFTAYWKA
ncbi:MAG: hypothetical protein ACKVTZ_21925 [Bacteroidia bacterium]